MMISDRDHTGYAICLFTAGHLDGTPVVGQLNLFIAFTQFLGKPCLPNTTVNISKASVTLACYVELLGRSVVYAVAVNCLKNPTPNPHPKPNPIRNPTTNPIPNPNPNPTNPIPYSSGNLLLRRKLHYARTFDTMPATDGQTNKRTF